MRSHSPRAVSPRLDRSRLRRAVALLAVLALAAACSSSDGTGTDSVVTKPTDSLHFLSPRADAPPLVVTTASFWAKKGDNRELRLYYHARLGESDSSEFLRFRVDAQSLDRRPDGSAIATGDSVQITVSVSDLTHLVVDFEPAGLRFAASRPARLTLKFAEADDDLNGDGEVNGEDAQVIAQLAIWRRESPTDPWVRQSSLVSSTDKEVDTDVLGFTNYAIAY